MQASGLVCDNQRLRPVQCDALHQLTHIKDMPDKRGLFLSFEDYEVALVGPR